MNELQIFKNNKFGEVRTIVDKNNNAWFCLKDICDILGIENSRNVKTRIKKSYVQEIDVGINTGLATQNFKMTFVNEPGLYDCIFASNKPEALEIKDWVFEYGKAKKQNEQLILENKEKDKQITELKPAKEYVDKILSTEDTMTITQIAADYGLSGLRLNQILHQERIIRNVGGQWLLYIEHMNKGYTRSETIIIKRKDGTEKVVPATKWTQKGRLKIHQTLTELGILANVDKEKKNS